MRRYRLTRFLSLAALALSMQAPAVYPQTVLAGQAPSVGIKGVIKDGGGSPIAGAKVTASNEATSWSASVPTKSDGSYLFSSLAPGKYTVRVEHAGFKGASRNDVILGSEPQTVNLVLLPIAVRTTVDSQQDHGPPDAKLGDFQYYDEAPLKAAEPVDPSAAGGYSDSAGAARRDLVKEYVAGPARRGGADSAASSPDEAAIERSASALLARQAYPEAVEVLRQGLTRFPRSERLEMGLGTALYARGQYDGALRAFLSAVDFAPGDPQPYTFLAKAYLAAAALSGGKAGSVEAGEILMRLDRRAKLEPDNAQAHYDYGAALTKAAPADESKRRQAEAELERAIALDPRFAEARLELGIIDARRGQYHDAIAQYREAVRLKPGLAEAHYRLGQAYTHTGDKAKAQTELDTYQRLRQKSNQGDGQKK